MALTEEKKYVLYIVPTDQHCTELLEKLKQEYNHILSKTHVQDVRVLPSRPTWLQFVPTLVERSTKKMYAGPDVIEFIKGMPQELTFDFVGGGGGKKNSMSSLSNGSRLNNLKLSTLKTTMTLEDEQKTQPAAPSAPAGSRLAEQQRRELETQKRIAEVNASRQASMVRRQPGEGARMTQDRQFHVESMGPQQYARPPPQQYAPPQQYQPPQQYGMPNGTYAPPQQPSMLARNHPGSTGYSAGASATRFPPMY